MGFIESVVSLCILKSVCTGTAPYRSQYMSASYMAPLTSAAQVDRCLFHKSAPSFHRYNGIFTSSSTPLSAVTMTAPIAFAKGLYCTSPW